MQLREWRKNAGLTLKQLSEKAGLSYAQVGRIERGKSGVSQDSIKRIVAATNGEVTAAELLGIGSPYHGSSLREDPATFEGAPMVSVAIPDWLQRATAEYQLDASALIAQGGISALETEARRVFRERNQEAIAANRQHVEAHGTLATRYGVFRRA